MKINYAILTHNEEEVFRILNQLRGKAVWIIDDHSREDYVARLRNHAAKPTVIPRALAGNFGAQRNFLSQFIPWDQWIVWFDADEQGSQGLIEAIERSIVTGVSALSLHRQNIITNGDGTESRTDERHIRAYLNNPRIFWVNHLHEGISGWSDVGILIEVPDKHFIIHHKSRERCNAQDAFYRSRFNHATRPIDKAMATEGWMNEPDLAWLAEQASRRFTVVELGCWKGRSTRALGENVHGRVYAIDHFRGSAGEEDAHKEAAVDHGDGVAMQFYANSLDLIERGKVVPIRASSAAAFAQLGKTLRPDMVFIDGDHTTPGLAQDLATWGTIVTKGGVLCGHDADWKGVQDALAQAGIHYKRYADAIWMRE